MGVWDGVLMPSKQRSKTQSKNEAKRRAGQSKWTPERKAAQAERAQGLTAVRVKSRNESVQAAPEREDMAVEKSRELGWTWWLLILCLWVTSCHRSKRVLAMSHTEKAVSEAANEDTLFGKLGFMLSRTPEWFKRGAYGRKAGFRFP